MIDEDSELGVIEWAQGLGGWLDPPMAFFSQLGNPLVIVLLVALIYWCIDADLGRRMALFTFATGAVNEVLKRTFAVARPFWLSTEVRSIGEGSTAFGLPSGHSVASLAWLFIPLRRNRRWVWAASASVTVMIGLSRIYLGAHFPSQVVAGWIVGGALFVMFVKYESSFLSWLTAMSLDRQLLAVVGLTFLLIGAGAASAGARNDFVVDAEWEQNAKGQIDETEAFDPVDINDIAANGGILAGSAVGMVLLAHGGGFRSSGSFLTRLLRFPVGLILVLGLLVVAAAVGGATGSDEGEGVARLVYEFASVFVVGLTVFFLAPLAFRRLGLVRPLSALPTPTTSGRS